MKLSFLQLLIIFNGNVSLLSAATLVDWWELESPNSETGLLDDQGANAGSFNLAVSSGLLFPNFPATRTLSESFFTTPFSIDNLSGDSNVSAIDIRVAATSGAPSYTIQLDWVSTQDVYILIGQLFANSSGATSPVSFDLTQGSISLINTFGWSNSIDEFTAELSWDSDNSRLSTLPTNDSDSEFALLRLSNTNSVTIQVPSAFPVGTGDTITLAIGSATIPEPSTTLFCLISCSVLILKRSRRQIDTCR